MDGHRRRKRGQGEERSVEVVPYPMMGMVVSSTGHSNSGGPLGVVDLWLALSLLLGAAFVATACISPCSMNKTLNKATEQVVTSFLWGRWRHMKRVV